MFIIKRALHKILKVFAFRKFTREISSKDKLKQYGFNMNKIIKIVEEYINEENTDYAVLLNGKWGCGKTYFFKNTLTSHIKALANKNGKPYNVKYVSLNGLSSINSLSSEIIASCLDINNRPKILKFLYKSSVPILNMAAPSLNIGSTLDELKTGMTDLLDFDDSLFCFDDIERIDSKLSLNEVFGYINTNFVESNNVKVLIIGDTTKIIDDDRFKLINEKLIGREIEFKYNYESIFNIILRKYENNKEYIELLNNYRNFILSLFKEYNITNLRTILFFTNGLQKYFFACKCNEDRVIKSIILFSITITNEFKDGQFNEDKDNRMKELSELSCNLFLLNFSKEDNNKSDSFYYQTFAKKYLNNYRLFYAFYYSIFDHIVNGHFDKNIFVKEVSPPENKIYNDSLNNLKDYLLLSEEELKTDIENVFKGLEEGFYNIYSHQYIFPILQDISINNILNNPGCDVKTLVLNSLEKAALRKDDFDSNIFDTEVYRPRLESEEKEIFERIKAIHEEHFNSMKKDIIISIVDRLDNDRADYSDIIHSLPMTNLSEILIPTQIVEKLTKASNHSVTKFFRFLAEKYRYDNYDTINDHKFIRELMKLIVNRIHVINGNSLKIKVFQYGISLLKTIDEKMELKKI